MAHIKETYNHNNNKMFKAIIESYESKQSFGETKFFDTKKDAERWLNNMLHSKNKNYEVDKSIITFGEQSDNWLKDKKTSLTKNAYNRYKDIINQNLKPYLGNVCLKELNIKDIKEYFDLKRNIFSQDDNNHRLTQRTVHRHYSVLNNVLKNAVELKLISTNPLKDFKNPKSVELPIMTIEECKKLLRVADKEDPFMLTYIFVSLMTGIRRNELLGLEWSDINFKEKYIVVKQILNHSGPDYTIDRIRTPRKIKINHQTVVELKKLKLRQNNMISKNTEEYNSNNHFVFCNSHGDPYHPVTNIKKFKNILKKSSLNDNYQIHSLRHTHFSLNEHILSQELIPFMESRHTIYDTLLLYKYNGLEI